MYVADVRIFSDPKCLNIAQQVLCRTNQSVVQCFGRPWTGDEVSECVHGVIISHLIFHCTYIYIIYIYNDLYIHIYIYLYTYIYIIGTSDSSFRFLLKSHQIHIKFTHQTSTSRRQDVLPIQEALALQSRFREGSVTGVAWRSRPVFSRGTFIDWSVTKKVGITKKWINGYMNDIWMIYEWYT